MQVESLTKEKSEKLLTSLLAKSIRTATHDNCQGFEFVISGPKLRVNLDPSVPQHVFDPMGMTSQVGFGFLLEYLNQVAAQEHAELVVTSALVPNFFPVELELKNMSLSEVYKIYGQATLEQRRCYRNRFSNLNLTQSQADQVKEKLASTDATVILHGSDQFNEITQMILDSDQILWLSQQAVADTFRFIRWSEKEYQKKKDGFHFRELGAKAWDWPLLKLIAGFPSLSPFIYPIIRPITQFKLNSCLQSSVGYFVITAADFSESSRVHLGRSGARSWLEATQMGLACQPFSMQSWLPCLFMSQKIHCSFSQQFSKLYKKASSLLGISDQPFWLFRFGQVPKTAYPLSLRRPARIRFD